VDEIVPEPPGGAHLDHEAAAQLLREALERALTHLCSLSGTELVSQRYEKFRRMGNFFA
jgi:acetyl-CoA carboxylase carboxyl transferase subunit alpha